MKLHAASDFQICSINTLLNANGKYPLSVHEVTGTNFLRLPTADKMFA